VTHKLILRQAAEQDLEDACRWCEKRQPGLGRRLLECVDETLPKLQQRPEFGLTVYKQLRRANVRRFPYGVFYQVLNDRIIVVAILHGRRAPRRWKSRAE
jgi:plasmid stabilization system protein ParE